MPDSTSGPAFAKVKRDFRFSRTCVSRFGSFVLAAGLLNCSGATPLDAAIARAQARLVAACGLEAAPSSVRIVPGYIACGDVFPAIGCTRTHARTVEVSSAAHGEDLDWVLVHEFLHLMGANHVPAGHGVMGPGLNSAVRRISAEDLAQVPCQWRRAED